MNNIQKKLHITSFSKRVIAYIIAPLCTMFVVTSCSLDKIVEVDDPVGGSEIDPNTVNSFSNGANLYYNSVGSLTAGVSILSRDVGMLTDELQITTPNFLYYSEALRHLGTDARIRSDITGTITGITSSSYAYFHKARTSAYQAREIISRFESHLKEYYLSAAYALEAQAILHLAENFCSGIPLSKMPFQGNVEYTDGFSTVELLNRAISLFDSSLALSHDSVAIRTLSRVGKAKALLSLGEYQEAGAAVADVAADDRFVLTYTEALPPGYTGSITDRPNAFWTTTTGMQGVGIGDREGLNGLQWSSPPGVSQDPRVPKTTTLPNRQNKFLNGNVTLPIARWHDALLIQAEANLEQVGDIGGAWLDPINELRSSIGLTDTTDPGSIEARVNLLFRERAFWLYLHGNRLADYRRLVRHYGRLPYNVYPSGPYNRSPGDVLHYGEVMVFSPGASEFELNTEYSGCINTNP